MANSVFDSAQIADLWVADLRVAEARCIETQYIETRLTEAEQFAAANPPQHSAQHIVRTVVNTGSLPSRGVTQKFQHPNKMSFQMF